MIKSLKLESKALTVYHGTLPKHVNNIKQNGLISKVGYNSARWYMVASDIESAIFHANPSDKDSNVYVFEFKIPNINNDRWEGYPYLWKGSKMSNNNIWYALRQPLPKKFISKIHIIKHEDWLDQKTRGF